MCRKRMPESVWADFFVQLNRLSQFSNYRKNHRSCKGFSSSVQKKCIAKFLFWFQERTAIVFVKFNDFLSRSTDRNKALFVAFSGYFDESFVEKEVRNF